MVVAVVLSTVPISVFNWCVRPFIFNIIIYMLDF